MTKQEFKQIIINKVIEAYLQAEKDIDLLIVEKRYSHENIIHCRARHLGNLVCDLENKQYFKGDLSKEMCITGGEV